MSPGRAWNQAELVLGYLITWGKAEAEPKVNGKAKVKGKPETKVELRV